MDLSATIGWLVMLSGSASAANPSELPAPMHWRVNGTRREAIVLFPDGPRRQASPLVLVIRGHGSTMEAIARKMPIQKHWLEAVVVYMQGIPTASRVDPKGKHAGWQSKAGTEGNRDLKFLEMVLKPGSVLHVAGRTDRTARIADQKEAMEKVREINGCVDRPIRWAPRCELYEPKKKSGAPYVSYIHPGGHSVPREAIELIVKFFKENP
jgi:polyhydroxybutyrate depolymerase